MWGRVREFVLGEPNESPTRREIPDGTPPRPLREKCTNTWSSIKKREINHENWKPPKRHKQTPSSGTKRKAERPNPPAKRVKRYDSEMDIAEHHGSLNDAFSSLNDAFRIDDPFQSQAFNARRPEETHKQRSERSGRFGRDVVRKGFLSRQNDRLKNQRNHRTSTNRESRAARIDLRRQTSKEQDQTHTTVDDAVEHATVDHAVERERQKWEAREKELRAQLESVTQEKEQERKLREDLEKERRREQRERERCEREQQEQKQREREKREREQQEQRQLEQREQCEREQRQHEQRERKQREQREQREKKQEQEQRERQEQRQREQKQERAKKERMREQEQREQEQRQREQRQREQEQEKAKKERAMRGEQEKERSQNTPPKQTDGPEKAFQKQDNVFVGARRVLSKGKGKSKTRTRYWKNVGLGFKTPAEAKTGTFVDKNCPFTGRTNIRGRILKGVIKTHKMKKTVIVRRDYLHYISKYQRYEKRHKNVAAHLSPAFRVSEGQPVVIGQCRPLSKTVKFCVLSVDVTGSKSGVKLFNKN